MSNAQSLSARADATRPTTIGLWPAMRRSPAAEHLPALPVARYQLWTALNAVKVCSTVPASDHMGIATVAPPPEPHDATCECVEGRGRAAKQGALRREWPRASACALRGRTGFRCSRSVVDKKGLSKKVLPSLRLPATAGPDFSWCISSSSR